ncbi:TnsA-like heteromeric transposase endonuclease subunit [Streptomyces noursei]|uniref:TnsA-like heteromeric transposase endonuclease subunit n=1 Tax=Streptomyces noursei TaxID=1971 RepID=UPI0037F17B24
MREIWAYHRDEQGQLVSARPAELAGVPLEERPPPSEPVAFHDRPGKLSDWWSVTTRGHVVCGSKRRRRVAIELDFDPNIAWFGGEPVELRWRGEQGKQRWRPDFVARTAGGARVVVAVEPEKIGAQWRERLEMLQEVAAAARWQVAVMPVPGGVRLANLEFAADYRQAVPITSEEIEAVEDAFRYERPIGEGALDSGVPYLAALDLAYRLIWQRRLQIHWGRPLLTTATAWTVVEPA